MSAKLNAPLSWPTLRRFVIFCGAFAVVAILVAVVYSSLLVPVAISCFLAYLLLPLVGRLERLRLPRTLAALVLVVGSVGLLIFAGVRLAPVLYRQILLLIGLLPNAFNTVLSHWLPVAERYVAGLGVASPEEVHQFLGLANVVGRLASQMQGALAGIWKTGTSVFGGLVTIGLIPVITFFLLKDFPALSAFGASLVPADLVHPVRRLLAKLDRTLRSVLKGQAIVAGILTVLYVVCLSAVGLQSSVAIGVVAGLCRIIPYFDVIVGGTLSAVVLLSAFGGWGQVLSVVLVFLGVQLVDGAFITPSVIGDRIGLHPLLVILSVFAFGDWLGFWGVLLAIPVAALAKVLLEASLFYYQQSRAFSGTRDLPAPASMPPTPENADA